MSNEANIKRLAEIQRQIEVLTEEGTRLADEEQVVFSLSGADFTRQYGSGGMKYYPNGDGPYIDPEYDEEVTNSWGDSVRGEWMASNSWGC